MTIVIASADSVENVVHEGVQTFSYHFREQPLVFDEPHYVRLADFLTPALNTFIITCDFVATSPVNGAYSGYLGVGNRTLPNTWIPLSSNTVPAIGFLHIRANSDRAPIVAVRDFKLVLEFLPESWLKHGGGSAIGAS